MAVVLILVVAVPLAAAAVVAVRGWGAIGAAVTVAAPCTVLIGGIVVASHVLHGPVVRAGLLRADALAAVMLLIIGSVGTLSAAASIGYLRRESAGADAEAQRARRYGVLVNLFVSAMTLAVLANNLGVTWVAIETTTIVTAFLVGHHGTRAALEATWKYVIICSVGIALAFLGTVLLYFASVHAGPTSGALDYPTLLARATQLDPGVTRLAVALLLLGYGTKVGLAPFHTWLADAHSQAPAPVSALMSGVLLSVALSVLLRVKTIADAALGTDFMRNGLLTMGLLSLAVAACLLLVQRDYKRLLAYSSIEHMALASVAAAAGTALAISALLLLLVVHGLAKAVMFISAGHLQRTFGSSQISSVRGLLDRSRPLALVITGGLVTLVGLPPFGMFAGELGIARGVAQARLWWPLAGALVLVLIAFAAVARHGTAMLLGDADPDAPPASVGATDIVILAVALAICLALGLTLGPFADLLNAAGQSMAVHR